MKCKKLYRDMEKYAAYKRRMQARQRMRGGAFAYASRPWTKEENEAVMRQDRPDAVLSKEIKRSVGAIQKQRYRMKRDAERERTCEVLGEDYDELLEYWETELSCGHVFNGMAEYVNYCPKCGAKIIGGNND